MPFFEDNIPKYCKCWINLKIKQKDEASMKLIQKSEDHNPWGKKPDKQGPPDLEDMIKNFFGGKKKKSSGGSGSGNGNSDLSGLKFLIPIVVVIAGIIWGLSGIFIVQPAEQAGVLRFGKYVKTVNPGMHWYPRFIERVIKVNVDEVNTIKLNKEMLTSRENIVHVAFTAQYHVGNVEDYLFNVINPVNTLTQSLDSSVRQSIGQNQLDKILTTGRAQITEEVRQELETLLKSYKSGIAINEVVMQPAQAPDAVKSAFDDVIKAREDREKMQNVAESYANRVVPVASGRAQRLLDEAGAYKQKVELQSVANIARFNSLLPVYKEEPSIVRSQLYFETMQSVLRDSKVFLVDGDGANNLFYWPDSQNAPSGLAKAVGKSISSDTSQSRSSSSTKPVSKNSMTRAEYMRWLEANQ
jgi:modulator of FtsH protease HflK